MQTFQCQCGNRLFFENSVCLSCAQEVGWCPACRKIVPLLPGDPAGYRCGDPNCNSPLLKCHNYFVEGVCNRCLVSDDATASGRLCDYCRFNETIPDMTVLGNREKWSELETAKRRLLYSLDLLGLPYGRAEEGFQPPLSFDFKADDDRPGHWSWSLEGGERVFTGHAHGKITINIREADPVEREKARVNFGEPHRTLIGHFRHEIGHYYWQMLVQYRREEEFKRVFGDHTNPTYDQAFERYYQLGPPGDWASRFVSAYATMHPWEDFAESFAAYLDMASVLDTALSLGFVEGVNPRTSQLDEMLAHYAKVGVTINELNRAMGLSDLVPEIFVPSAVEKLRFIHQLVRDSG